MRYSLFIQDCFDDLTDPVLKHKARIYQYVGDEAILYWPLNSGILHHRCLKIFFDYQSQLASRNAYYLDKYGVVPEFKAGMHCGPVTLSEVGIIKREIAFHGDVLNTAARLQGKCNQLGKPFLISQDLLEKLPKPMPFDTEEMPVMELRGKEGEVRVIGVG